MSPSSTGNTLLNALTCRGVLVNVSIRYWRARKKLNPEDIGLKDSQVNNRLISLGHKKLLPKDCLKNLALIESRAHALVEENTFPFLNGVARYLPNERLEEINARLENLRQQFRDEKTQFLRQYAAYRDEALTEWRTTARNLVSDPDRLVAVINAAFPQPEYMDRYFGFHVSMFQVRTPDMPRAELVEAGTRARLIEARENAAREARERIESSCSEFIRDCTSELRQQTARLCDDMVETINGTGYVHQKTLNRLIRFIDHFKELNFVNDTQMEQMLENVRSEFLTRTAQEYRDSSSSRRSLVGGLETLRDRASEMARADTAEIVESFGQLGRRRFEMAA